MRRARQFFVGHVVHFVFTRVSITIYIMIYVYTRILRALRKHHPRMLCTPWTMAIW